MTRSRIRLTPSLLLTLGLGIWAAFPAASGASPTAALASDSIVVYRPQARTAEELEPVARSLLGPTGTAIADPGGRGLVLRGDPERVRETLEVLAELDVRPASYRVEASVSRSDQLEALGIGVDGWLEVGGLRVGRVPADPGEGSGLEVRAEQATAAGERSFEGMVTVLEGRSAELWTGTLEREHSHHVHPGPRGDRVHTRTTWIPVRTGFRVTPHGLENGEVELEIEPVVSSRRDDGAIERTGAATRVRVRPGETVAIAGLDSSEQAAKLDTLEGDRSRIREESALVVRVTVLD